MNELNSFSDFYNSLSSDGIFLFWIILFLFCFLIFLTVVLLIKNKKLIKLLKEDKKEIEEEKEDIINVIENNKKEIEEPKIFEIKDDIEKKEEPVKEMVKEEKGPYKKNVLREMNARTQTSPIHIDRNDEETNYGFSESYLREETVSPLEMLDDNYEINDNMKFASEIVERMEEEIRPSNIELTDYEKKQEEEAIISYDELLKVKDKIYNINEDEDTEEFIDELKSFRLDL